MKKSIVTTLYALFMFGLAVGLKAQTDDFTVKFSGFVKTDAFFDTRQMEALREGHISLWPSPKKLDDANGGLLNGEDLNDRANFHILSIQTRAAAKVDGPGIFGGRTSGYVEAEFLGSTEATINSLRLRHAYVDLDFEKIQIRAGQFWHPLFSTDNFPNVISFNTGIPFIPFNRAPQIKVTGKFGNMKPFFAISSQRDFASKGPAGTSPQYLRNSGVPELSAGFNYYTPDVSFGLAAATTSILPNAAYTIGAKSYKNDDQLRTVSVSGNFRVAIDKFQIKLMGNYAQNNPDFLMIGGFGVKSMSDITHTYEYTPITSVSGWLELMYKDAWEYGVVAGLSQNLGASDDMTTNIVYGSGLDIDKVIKVYPRIAYNFNKTKLGLEVEYSSAYYGDIISQNNKKVENAEAVNNLRVLLAFYVFF